MDAEDSKLQFTFNGSLVNKHFEEITDILMYKIKSKNDVIKNRAKIIELLSETFINIDENKLAKGFDIFANNLPQDVFNKSIKYGTISEVIKSYAILTRLAYNLHSNFNDHGYSLVVMAYFWLTSKYLETAN